MSTTRKSVPLDASELEALNELTQPGNAYRTALAELTGVELGDGSSEADVLRALLSAGRAAVAEKVAVTGYAAWAADMDEEDIAYRRARRGWDRGE
ncbi:hypothetical protein OS965_41080 [Streptomyces sp. H27-G5]|uniref:hypothetical protein n=1 Tax=Streptomyces sp. H27-G5 TaxID=2996698 RepID=UPI00226D6404|nr:hypothetical protein [Streptomyces sp. H27-G5]MCY0924409.1 hypothetical protein [Streptomyces sp. H27-G5]